MNQAPSAKSLNEWLNQLQALATQPLILGLSRLRPVAERLNVLTWDNPVVMVAGTNGKGSCVALTQAILQSAGYRCGTYTSPHLLRYNERVCISGQAVSDAELCLAFTAVEQALQGVVLTYFEFSTLAALWLFKQAQLDVIILEVGLGGRWDAVNIVDAEVSIISSIDLDHMRWLGETREQIAYEKAGIMKAAKPCVWGESNLLPDRVIQYAQSLNVPLFIQGQEFGIVRTADDHTWTWWSTSQSLEKLPIPRIYLSNAACVLQAIQLLQGRLAISRDAINEGLKHVSLSGRFQVVEYLLTTGGSIDLILDVAHNPASGCLLARNLKRLPKKGRSFAVVGMLKDKAVLDTLSPLVNGIDSWHIGDLEGSRGASATQLTACLKALSVSNFYSYSSIPAAFKAVLELAMPGDKVVIFGSFHTVAAIIPLLNTGGI